MEKQVFVPEKSPNDQRQYKAVLLANELRLLMIQDPKAQKSACAISVRIGSLADPDSSLGLAHFLEHMLFMGSSKYPAENEYSEFISLNAGHDNAFTDDLETNYYFDIGAAKFLEGVDRMSEFFKSALLKANCVEKERQAVHEEYMLWVNDDNCRKWGVLHQIANGQFSRFSIGNQETLNHPKIMEDLKSFYDKNYSSNRINAVLLSNMDLKELEQKVVGILSQIPNKHAEPPVYKQPFLPSQLSKLIKIQSIKDEHIMEFFWVVDPLRELYKKHIDEYLGHVLGHEGQNSILNLLKQNGFASSLSAYEHHIVNATVIGVQITLTVDGFENYETVYDMVIKYISNLKPNKKIYDELKLRNALFFQFQQKIDNTSYVSKLAQRLHYYPLENVLNYKNIFEEFDEKAFNHIFSQLTPSRLLLAVSSPDVLEGATIEKYLRAPYKLSPLPKLSKQKLDKMVIQPNPFLPVDVTIHPTQPNQPRKIAPNVIFLQDYNFNICKGGITINVYSNQDKTFQTLYSSWLESMLKTQIYDAQTLGVSIDFEYSSSSLSISYYGFTDTLLKLLKTLPQSILKIFDHKEKAEGIFEIEHESLSQQFDNLLLEASNDVAEDYLRRILNGKKNTTIEQDIENLHKLDFSTFNNMAKSFWKNATIEWVFVGNFLEKDVLALVQSSEATLKSSNSQIQPKGCLKLTKDIAYELSVPADQIKTSATLIYFQHKRETFRDRIMLEILKTYVKEPFFNDLRTLKQLAYYVATVVRVNRGILGMYFLLVSSNADPLSVANQMKEFLVPFFSQFKDQTEQQMNKLKQAVLINLSQPHDSLDDLNTFIVSQVTFRTYGFNRKDKAYIQQVIATISKEDLVHLANELLRHSLSIYVVAKCHEESYKAAGTSNVSDFNSIKNLNEYFPDYIQDSLSSTDITKAKVRKLQKMQFWKKFEHFQIQRFEKQRNETIELHRKMM